MTVAPARRADSGLEPVVTRHRVAVRGRWVDVWMTVAEDVSLSVAGSRLAERLAAEALGVPSSAVRVAALAPSGRPVVLPAGIGADRGLSVSISHLRERPSRASVHPRGHVAAAACRGATVGIDLVAPADVSAESIGHFLTTGGHPPAATRDAVRLWAAKEAAYKAAALDEAFRPRRIVVSRISDNGFRWSVSGRYQAVHGSGCFVAEDGRVLAVAVADHIPSMSRGASALP